MLYAWRVCLAKEVEIYETKKLDYKRTYAFGFCAWLQMQAPTKSVNVFFLLNRLTCAKRNKTKNESLYL